MKALQFHDKHDIRLNDIETPHPRPGQVRVRPSFVGICGTDVHEYTRGATLIPQTAHVLTGRAAPLTLGHEISGVVDRVGNDVTRLRVGDHVAILPILSDDTCYACRQNKPNCCAKQGFYGLSTDGGLAEHIVVEERNARLLPATIDLDVGALIEPLAVGWHAVGCGLTKTSSSALVMGAGAIGLCVTQALKARNINVIIVADPNAARHRTARTAGATHVIDPSKGDLLETVARICASSEGAHVAFDTAGKQITLDQCIAAVCVSGTVVNIAIWGGPARIMPNDLLLREKRYLGTSVYTREDFDAVIEAVASGVIEPRFMITSKIGLGDVVSQGIPKLLDPAGHEVKVLVAINGKSSNAQL
ncbi:hypothetical protein LTR17_008868 [Elasticomyces elasticus]|nr:hypothetical protein LTR17_008868 [Elasticomyces elasticus]